MQTADDILAILASGEPITLQQRSVVRRELLDRYEAARLSPGGIPITLRTNLERALHQLERHPIVAAAEPEGEEPAAAPVGEADAGEEETDIETLFAEIAAELDAEEVEEPEPVAASTRTPVGDRRVPAANRPRVPAQPNRALVSAAGRELSDLDDLHDEFNRAMRAGTREGFALIAFAKGRISDHKLASGIQSGANAETNGAIIAAARAELTERIESAGSLEALVAAGGVCGPATPYYGQLSNSTAARPVRDALVSFDGDGRGAVSYVPPPELVDIGISGGSPNQAVDIITNAEDISNTTKPHQLIACGQAATVTVDAIPLILEAGNLFMRTSSEQWAAWIAKAQAAHARLAEKNLLTQMASASTAVTSTNGGGLGASRDLLRDWRRAASALRDRERMDPNAVIQLVVPHATVDLFAGDLAAGAYGPGNMDNFAIAQQTVEGWLRAGNIAVTWSLEKASAGNIYTAQTAGPLRPWPSTVTAYIYAPGTFGFLDGGELDLGIVRDSTLNAANKFQFQMETFEAVLPLGGEALALTSTVCASGGSMGTNDPDELCDDGGS